MNRLTLIFTKSAERDWQKLDEAIRKRFRQLLQRALINQVERNRLRGYPDSYKIKIVKPQFRLVYRIDKDNSLLIVLAVGPRDGFYDDLP